MCDAVRNIVFEMKSIIFLCSIFVFIVFKLAISLDKKSQELNIKFLSLFIFYYINFQQ